MPLGSLNNPVHRLSKTSPTPCLSRLCTLVTVPCNVVHKEAWVYAEGVPLGDPCTLYYDAKRGSLPQGAKPVFKAGLNRWESIQLADMSKAEAAPSGNSEWWSVDITIPKVSFQKTRARCSEVN